MKSTICRAYKFRIYPTKNQEVFFAKHFGCARFVYNHFLAVCRNTYRKDGRSIRFFECKKMLTSLKKSEDYVWLKQVNSQSLQEVIINLFAAYNRFFKKVPGARYPRFKKKSGKQSFKIPQHFTVNFDSNEIIIPKLKTTIKARFHRPFNKALKLNSITISKTTSEKYYASISVLEEIVHRRPVDRIAQKTKTVGIDLGLSYFLIESNGNKVGAPKYLRKSEMRIKRAQKKLSKKARGSNNRKKQRKIVARLHEKISNQRSDFLHKESHRIICENQAIYLETLNIRGMIKNRCLSKSIADAGWGEFVRQLQYKAEWNGTILVQVGQWEPTSKLCSTEGCSYKNNSMKLSDRNWVCPMCKVKHDRDINAAKNIEQIGREAPELKPVEKVANVFSIKKIQAASVKQESLAL